MSDFLAQLITLKKDPAINGMFEVLVADTHLQSRWINAGHGLYGMFNIQSLTASVLVELSDGAYTSLLDDTEITVSAGQMELPLLPVIVRF